MPPRTALEGIPSGESATPKSPQLVGEAGTSHGALSATLAELLTEPETTAPKSAKIPVEARSKSPLAPHSLSGVFIGDGLSPVPAKLVTKILRRDFVEMGELLPEFHALSRDEDGASRSDTKSHRSWSVTDILTWLQCFGTYVGVLAPSQPDLVPELMSYMSLIIRVSQEYSGLAWVRYDSAFRRQAALTGNKRWSVVNSSLYAINFTGTAKAIPRCELCFATTHSDKECAQQGNPDPGMKDRLRAIETAILALTTKPSAGFRGQGGTLTWPVRPAAIGIGATAFTQNVGTATRAAAAGVVIKPWCVHKRCQPQTGGSSLVPPHAGVHVSWVERSPTEPNRCLYEPIVAGYVTEQLRTDSMKGTKVLTLGAWREVLPHNMRCRCG